METKNIQNLLTSLNEVASAFSRVSCRIVMYKSSDKIGVIFENEIKSLDGIYIELANRVKKCLLEKNIYNVFDVECRPNFNMAIMFRILDK